MNKKQLFNQRGFTLMEMMIVLLAISVILLVAIPNITKQSNSVNEKGCEALVHMLQSQVQLYHMENNNYPVSFEELEDFMEKEVGGECPNGAELELTDGVVSIKQ
ncbi:MAG TPA: competence type IV pilus major pilin ComGC [Bacillaceae bacterium]|nr:competence type IV pilus major pilin ComGC [Paenibacillus bovis]HLU22192.1 competence type IV pilus major pilin ComGC [Bacillaceae bacterium]